MGAAKPWGETPAGAMPAGPVRSADLAGPPGPSPRPVGVSGGAENPVGAAPAGPAEARTPRRSARALSGAARVGLGGTRTATTRADQLGGGVRRLPQQGVEFSGGREAAASASSGEVSPAVPGRPTAPGRLRGGQCVCGTRPLSRRRRRGGVQLRRQPDRARVAGSTGRLGDAQRSCATRPLSRYRRRGDDRRRTDARQRSGSRSPGDRRSREILPRTSSARSPASIPSSRETRAPPRSSRTGGRADGRTDERVADRADGRSPRTGLPAPAGSVERSEGPTTWRATWAAAALPVVSLLTGDGSAGAVARPATHNAVATRRSCARPLRCGELAATTR